MMDVRGAAASITSLIASYGTDLRYHDGGGFQITATVGLSTGTEAYAAGAARAQAVIIG